MTSTDPRPRPQDLAGVQTISRTDQKSALNHEWEPATLTNLATLMELATLTGRVVPGAAVARLLQALMGYMFTETCRRS